MLHFSFLSKPVVLSGSVYVMVVMIIISVYYSEDSFQTKKQLKILHTAHDTNPSQRHRSDVCADLVCVEQRLVGVCMKLAGASRCQSVPWLSARCSHVV